MFSTEKREANRSLCVQRINDESTEMQQIIFINAFNIEKPNAAVIWISLKNVSIESELQLQLVSSNKLHNRMKCSPLGKVKNSILTVVPVIQVRLFAGYGN